MDDHGGNRESEVATQLMARRRERRYLLLVAGLAPVGVLPVVALLAVADEPLNGGPLFVAGVAFALLAVVSGVAVAFGWWRRRSGSALFARSPLWELPSLRQRSRLVKALRRGDPIPAELQPLAVRVAQDIVRRRGVIWLHLGIGVFQGVNAFVQDGAARWFALAAMLGFLSGAAHSTWLRGRMRNALTRLES